MLADPKSFWAKALLLSLLLLLFLLVHSVRVPSELQEWCYQNVVCMIVMLFTLYIIIIRLDIVY